MADVFLALGTNLGDKQGNLEKAIVALGEHVTISAQSKLYETAPMYVEDQPAFLNMVVRGDTPLSPYQLLDFLKRLEEELGREPTFRNGPRMIDLDILYFDDLLLNDDRLQIPHLRIGERSFVLCPLSDISEKYVDIRSGKTVANMLKELGDVSDVKICTKL